MNIEERRQAVGRAVERRRESLGYNQAEFARTVDVDPKTLRALENGSRWPQRASRRKIEAGLTWNNGSLAQLLDGEGSGMSELEDGLTKPIEINHASPEQTANALASTKSAVERLSDAELINELSERLTAATEMQAWMAQEMKSSRQREDALEHENAQLRAQLEEQD